MPVCNDLYYFLHTGAKPSTYPALLLHGAGGNHLFWPAELRRLSGYRVLTPDLPGHGKSEGVGKHTVQDYAHAMLEFLDAVSIWKTVLIGHGLGSAIALTMALDAPERVAGLGLLSCGTRLPLPGVLLENASNPTTHLKMLQSLTTVLFSTQTDHGIITQTSQMLAKTRPAVLHGDLLACSTFDVTNSLEGLYAPTLILCGTEDRITPLHLAKGLSNAIPDAALQTIDGAGHAVMLEQPRRVAALLSVFLKTIPYLPGT